MVGTIVERLIAALRIAGSIPTRKKYLYGLQVVVLDQAVCVCNFSMVINAPTIQELSLVRNTIYWELRLT